MPAREARTDGGRAQRTGWLGFRDRSQILVWRELLSVSICMN